MEASDAGEERVVRALWRWLEGNNRCFVAPAPEQLRALRDAVRVAPRLGERLRLELNHLLRALEPF